MDYLKSDYEIFIHSHCIAYSTAEELVSEAKQCTLTNIFTTLPLCNLCVFPPEKAGKVKSFIYLFYGGPFKHLFFAGACLCCSYYTDYE